MTVVSCGPRRFEWRAVVGPVLHLALALAAVLLTGCGFGDTEGRATQDLVLGSYAEAARRGDRDALEELIVPNLAEHARERYIDAAIARSEGNGDSRIRITDLDRSAGPATSAILEGETGTGEAFEVDVSIVEVSGRWYWLPDD